MTNGVELGILYTRTTSIVFLDRRTNSMVQREQWNGFKGRIWKEEVNTRDFIQNNYTPYEGDSSFLAGPTKATETLWGILQGL